MLKFETFATIKIDKIYFQSSSLVISVKLIYLLVDHAELGFRIVEDSNNKETYL